MKKLIFLLFPVFSYGQITISKLVADANALSCLNIANINLVSTAFTANKVYICVAMVDSCSSYGTITGGSNTWNVVSQQQTGTGNTRRLSVWRTTSVATETVTMTLTVGNARGVWFDFYLVEGVPNTNNGADAILQAVKDSGSSANPVITMGGLLNNRSAVLSFFHNNANPFGGTPESSWTETEDNGCTFGGVLGGMYSMHSIGINDNTPTVTASSSNWMGVALELRALGRRATVIN